MEIGALPLAQAIGSGYFRPLGADNRGGVKFFGLRPFSSVDYWN